MTTTTTGARQAPDPIVSGVEMAAARFGRHSLEVDDFELEHARDLATSFRDSQLEPTPDRALELLAEHIAIAVLMRRQNNEPPITQDDIGLYADSARRFLNSFWHDDL